MPDNDAPLPEPIRNPSLVLGHTQYHFTSVGSTMIVAKRLAEAGSGSGAEEGVAVTAETQTSGYGRHGRKWESPPGSLLLSVILRPGTGTSPFGLLGLVPSIAVAETITASAGVNATVKWPNDVLVTGKKVAGCLLESAIMDQVVQFVVMGVGVNLNIDPGSLPHELAGHATSLACHLGHPVDQGKFMYSLFQSLSKWYENWRTKSERVHERWLELSDTIGREVRIVPLHGGVREITGHAIGLSTEGLLEVQTSAGTVERIVSGDCVYIEKR